MGFGVYSDSISSLSVTYSTSYTATYSISGSQSITFKRTGDFFYLKTNDTSVYKIDISRAEWGTYSNVYQPIPYKISPIQSISIKKPYGWTFSGSTQSSNISIVIPGYLGLYSTNKPSFKEGDVVGFYASSKFYPTARVVGVYNYPNSTNARLYLSAVVGAPKYTTTTKLQNAKYDTNGKHTLCYRLDGNPNSVTEQFFIEGNKTQENYYEGKYPWIKK